MLELCALHVNDFVRHGTCHSPQSKLSDDDTHTERYKSILNGRQYTNLCAQTAGLCDDLTFAIAYRIYSIQIMFQISASSLKT